MLFSLAILSLSLRRPGLGAVRDRVGAAWFAQLFGPPLVFPLAIPDIAEVWQHLFAEQLDVLHRQLMRHRADMQEHHQIADAQFLDRLHQLLSDGLGRARDDE